jgi:hypothetical protein
MNCRHFDLSQFEKSWEGPICLKTCLDDLSRLDTCSKTLNGLTKCLGCLARQHRLNCRRATSGECSNCRDVLERSRLSLTWRSSRGSPGPGFPELGLGLSVEAGDWVFPEVDVEIDLPRGLQVSDVLDIAGFVGVLSRDSEMSLAPESDLFEVELIDHCMLGL